MIYLKKLIFALPFILATSAFGWRMNIFLSDFSQLFSLNASVYIQTLWLALILFGVAVSFTIFSIIAIDWKIIIPIALLASFTMFPFVIAPYNFILIALFAISFGIDFLIFNKLITKDAVVFNVSSHIKKPYGQLVIFLLIAASTALYFSVSATKEVTIQKMTDSLVNLSSGLLKIQQGSTQTQNPLSNLSISPEQLQYLKQNPQLLKQAGLDASLLNQLSQEKPATPEQVTLEAIKPMIKQQFNEMIKPFLPYIPVIITAMFFFNIQFEIWIISLILSPLINLLFWILEKIGFIRFEITMREVKKLVV